MSVRQLAYIVEKCDRCPRLRQHCELVAREKRKAFMDWDYWGKPVPGFGDPGAQLWILGLAPGAHGANRTGRVFTGDQSGHFLYAALHRAAFANQPTSLSRNDGLKLTDCFISAAARCAPPGNKPTPQELSRCSEYLDIEWKSLKRKKVILALGKIAWDAAIALARRQRCEFEACAFGHGAKCRLSERLMLIGSYHVSQQNTFTGKLTAEMFDAVLKTSRALF
jgi:uracil-DNA glycosylase family 4